MNFLFDAVLLLFAILFQLLWGSFAASGFPFALCSLLVIAMRRNSVTAVILAFFSGLVIDFVFGREFAVSTISLPLALAVGSLWLPDDPMRFFFGDYIVPGCAAVFADGLVRTVTPLFFGEEWYYLVREGAESVLSTVAAAGIFPLWVLASDRIAYRLDLHRIFNRTIKFALRPARR